MAKAKVQQTCENQWSTLYTSNNKFRDKRLKKAGKIVLRVWMTPDNFG